MAVRFTDIPATTPAIERPYSHLIVVAERGIASGDLSMPRAIAVDSNNRIFIAGEYPPHVSIFSVKGEFLKTFSHEEMASPWGIAVHGDNLYVTDSKKHTVLHFKMTSVDIHFVARIGGYGSVQGKFMFPKQLTVSVCGEIFVTDSLNNRIQILDNNLSYQRCISHESMSQPYDVKLTQEEVYVLSYISSYCIQVFSIAGVKLRSLITKSIGMQVNDSSFFCLDTEQNLIISDVHKIKLFMRDGTCSNQIDIGLGQGMFYCPQGIALTDDEKLVVVFETYKYFNRLQIFSK